MCGTFPDTRECFTGKATFSRLVFTRRSRVSLFHMKITPQQSINGLLYLCIGVFGAAQAAFGNDEAYKYVDPTLLFWMRTVSGIALAGVSAVKMYLSGRTFAEKPQPQPQQPTGEKV